MWKKFARIPLSLPKRGSGVFPVWDGKKNFFGPITFRTHIGTPIRITFITYIQKLHLEITFQHTLDLPHSFTYPPLAHPPTHLPHYIKFHPFYLHLEHTLEVHQNYFPRHPLPASMPIIITFRNYISNIHQNYISFIYSLIRLPTTSFTLRPPIDVLSHYNYIQNTHLELHSNTHQNYIIITLRIILHLCALLVPISLQLHYNYIQNYIHNLALHLMLHLRACHTQHYTINIYSTCVSLCASRDRHTL